MSIESAVEDMVGYWLKQSIVTHRRTREEVSRWEMRSGIVLPDDFVRYFLLANGMESLYPNYIDEEGFLFYPLEALSRAEDEFAGAVFSPDLADLVIFAEYMHASWWYGVKMEGDGSYSIGITGDRLTFQVITTSLAEFIYLYIADSERLYGSD